MTTKTEDGTGTNNTNRVKIVMGAKGMVVRTDLSVRVVTQIILLANIKKLKRRKSLTLIHIRQLNLATMRRTLSAQLLFWIIVSNCLKC